MEDLLKTTKTYQALQYKLKGNRTFEELKLCTIPVCIQGERNKQTFDLLVDTGAQITVLSQLVANIIGVETNSLIKSQGIGGASEHRQGIVKIEIGRGTGGSISLGDCRVAIGQLSTKFSEYQILGILGAEAVQEICLKIDYPAKYLELIKSLKVEAV
jgi:hypothetical protein